MAGRKARLRYLFVLDVVKHLYFQYIVITTK
jgi:hypothetical protein